MTLAIILMVTTMASREIMKRQRWRLAVLRHALDLTNNVALTCRLLGVSRTTFYVWKRRWKAEGPAGLRSRSRRPRRQPRRTPPEVVAKILYWRIGLGLSPVKIKERLEGDHGLRLSAPGIWKILKRLGLSRRSSPSPRRRNRPGWTASAVSAGGTEGLIVTISPVNDPSRTRSRAFLYMARDEATGLTVRRVYRTGDSKTAVEFLEYALAWFPLRFMVIETGAEPVFHGYFHWHILSQGFDHVVKAAHSADSQALFGGRIAPRREGWARLAEGVVSAEEPSFNRKLALWKSLSESGPPESQRIGR